MASQQDHVLVPHQGRMAPDGITPLRFRQDMAWVCPDNHGDLPPYILIRRSSDPTHTPRDLHWMIVWAIKRDEDVWRVIHVVQERAVGAEIANDYLSNPHPRTHFLQPDTVTQGRLVGLATLTRPQRQLVEQIVCEHPVRAPDGRWNCQDFIEEVLERAIAADIIDRHSVQSALADARRGFEVNSCMLP
ncbi:hypothetical protein OE88DRAFT_1140594 [Heliocybe sulcata]|uniref:Uncharacterized protein n=1 Tax=Heliocybe sulcata TaxID=5364 RepID=A0A5C3NDC5_9AGAM|nr:hypothetical protein OE88DRAFT_1140594 [Heliocybe sulcata]